MDIVSNYFENKFLLNEKKKSLQQEIYIEFWEGYLDKNNNESGFEILKKFYPQLCFPIEKDINKTSDYGNAVLKGTSDFLREAKYGLDLKFPDEIKIKIHESIAGKIPVITVPHDKDFTTIIQCFLHKNNPEYVPLSMGAAFIPKINNWSRIHKLRKEWLKNNPFGNWATEFSKNILPYPDLYKDQIIVLSAKAYSNIPALQLGLLPQKWLSDSLSIRLEHECTHLFTLKTYGSASHNLHDELIADYVGIVRTFGGYDQDMMLTFLGLENYPKYRKGARLENYLPDLPEDSFNNICTIIKNAITNISSFDEKLGKIHSQNDLIARINALCETNLINLASICGMDLLTHKYDYKK